MTSPSDTSRGLLAAFGARQPLRSSLRRWLLHQARRLDHRFSEPARAAYLEFIPPPRTSSELADLSARIAWYLPEAARRMPVYVQGDLRASLVQPAEAPYMDGSLVHDPGFVPSRPGGRRHRVIHRLTPQAAISLALRPRTTTLVAADFAYGAEEAYFSLHDAVCTTVVPDPRLSVDRLLARRVDGGSALVLGTGPSAKLIDPASVDQEITVVCNSVVRDHEFVQILSPDVIAFGDPVFHFGPSRYARAFRDDLLAALDSTDAIALTTDLFARPLIAHVPSIIDRLVVLPMKTGESWWWPDAERMSARITGNVLTSLMLPAALALADDVAIAGCDGRQRTERYFWSHNTQTQYTDDLMQTVFDAHPAFFRDRSYADYYERHCDELEAFLVTAESAGKRISAITPSHIPALRRRGAPFPATEPIPT